MSVVQEPLSSSFDSSYPPHYNSFKVPDHHTLSELKADRLAEARNVATHMFEEYIYKYPYKVPEEPPAQNFYVDKPM